MTYSHIEDLNYCTLARITESPVVARNKNQTQFYAYIGD